MSSRVLASALLVAGAAREARAGGVAVFQGLEVTVATGLNTPSGTAVDAGGNVYVADAYNARVLKLPRGSMGLRCNAGCSVVGSGFVRPNAVAMDGSGNLYVTDAAAQTLTKVVTVGGAQTVLATGLAGVSGVAVAADGTIYAAVAGAVTRTAPTGAMSTFASGPAQPGGIAVDANGNVYVADTGGNQVLRFTSNGAQSTVATGLNAPRAIAVDAAGNLYIADTGNNRVVSLSAAASGAVCPGGCTVSTAQVSAPGGVSVDASGNLYVADTGNNQLVKLAQDVDFGSFPVTASNATPQASMTLKYLLATSGCGVTPAVAVLLRGVPGKDFTSSAADNVCTPGTQDTFAITVKFSPLFPGLRTGAVQMTDATGVSQVATYLHGIGNGPEITWTPGVVHTVLSNPGSTTP